MQGGQWMKQVISFDKLKLTNNQLDDNGHVSIFYNQSLLFKAILQKDEKKAWQNSIKTAHYLSGGGL